MYRPYALLYAVHGNEVTHTACKNKAVKNFMGAEIFVQMIKNREFAGINNSTDGVNDTAHKKPEKGFMV